MPSNTGSNPDPARQAGAAAFILPFLNRDTNVIEWKAYDSNGNEGSAAFIKYPNADPTIPGDLGFMTMAQKEAAIAQNDAAERQRCAEWNDELAIYLARRQVFEAQHGTAPDASGLSEADFKTPNLLQPFFDAMRDNAT
ncbi:Uu.00g130890.m01.CDS01 [Anthostomella pinea]|uniref:Uu.00g130890.m01.CDS01 n=1 Tax=Anthostomella pinea TaxID=933095 RepID=A0AAI8VJQ6_9PEZI|nr:Uu.00g130890.m01.CDS01 [Anthostomella pinea]